MEQELVNVNLKYDKLRMEMNEMKLMLMSNSIQCKNMRNGRNMKKNKYVYLYRNKHKNKNNNNNNKVYIWLRDNVGLEEYYDIFMENGLDDIEILKQINNDHLTQIGVHKIGHRIKIMKYIALLQDSKK